MAYRYAVTHTFFLLCAQTRSPTICRSHYIFRHITKKIPRNPGLLIAQRKLRDIHPGTFVSELSTSLNNIQVIMHPTSCQCKIGNRTLHQRPLTNLWAAFSNEPNGSQNRKQSRSFSTASLSILIICEVWTSFTAGPTLSLWNQAHRLYDTSLRE